MPVMSSPQPIAFFMPTGAPGHIYQAYPIQGGMQAPFYPAQAPIMSQTIPATAMYNQATYP
jgi:hypothetical protein